jgi:hypothetical protein
MFRAGGRGSPAGNSGDEREWRLKADVDPAGFSSAG